MGREPDEGVGSENPPGQGYRRVILAHMDAIGANFEGKVGSIVENEGHACFGTHVSNESSSYQERLGVQLLLSQLDDVHPSGDTGRHKFTEIRSVRSAEVEVAVRDGAGWRHALVGPLAFALTGPFAAPVAVAFALAFMACLCRGPGPNSRRR